MALNIIVTSVNYKNTLPEYFSANTSITKNGIVFCGDLDRSFSFFTICFILDTFMLISFAWGW